MPDPFNLDIRKRLTAERIYRRNYCFGANSFSRTIHAIYYSTFKKIFLTTSRRTNYFYWIFSSSSVSYPGMSLGRRSDRYYFSKLFDFFVCTWVIDAVVVNMNELCCFVEYFVKKLSCWRIIIYNTIILSCKHFHLFSFHGMWDRLN